MIKSGFSYLKLTALVAVLAMTLIGLSGLLSVTTFAQGNETTTPREIDLRAKLKGKTFADGRRVEIHKLDSGEKLVAEVKDGKFLNWFLVAADGTEVKGVVKKKTVTANTVATCSETITTTTTTTNWRGKKPVVVSTSTVIQIPCAAGVPGALNP